MDDVKANSSEYDSARQAYEASELRAKMSFEEFTEEMFQKSVRWINSRRPNVIFNFLDISHIPLTY